MRLVARPAATAFTFDADVGEVAAAKRLATRRPAPACWCSTACSRSTSRVGDRIAAELLGPGDLRRAMRAARTTSCCPARSTGGRWCRCASRCSTLVSPSASGRGRRSSQALLRRAERRAHNLNVQRAIASQPRLEVRLALLLWHLAARWGRVEPGGIRLPLPLTHQLLGRLVGAERPSVSHALARLARSGLVTGHGDEWHLHGNIEEQLQRMVEPNGGRVRRSSTRRGARGHALMRTVEFGPGYARAERQLVHVVWLTSGLGCDGDSVAMTSATSPSLEDLLQGVLPGMPRIAIYNPLLAYETGEEFMRAFRDAAAGAA